MAMQNPVHHGLECRRWTYHHDDPVPKWIPGLDMTSPRRGNYNSGEDFVLEYGELRFTFNERDFAERCEQAGLKLGFVGGRLADEELEDLVNLAVNGEISDPASAIAGRSSWDRRSARWSTGCAGWCSAGHGLTSA
jgi:hypothetical protein